MELRGTRPTGVVAAEDMAALTRLTPPVLSLYMNTDPDIDNAAYRDEQRWRGTRRSLVDEGVPEAILDQIEPMVPEAHLHGSCLAVIANAEGVQWVEHGRCALTASKWTWGPLAHLVPLLEWRQGDIPYVLVSADRTGADIFGVCRGRPEVHQQAGGATDPIRKVAPGGWSQRRFQQRAENTWEHNAHDAAQQVVDVVRETGARVVLVGGDVRALQLLRDSLPVEVREQVVEIPVTRAHDGSQRRLDDAVARELDTISGHDATTILQKYAEELGQNDRAVDGIDETVGALQRAQVDVLLLMESGLPDRTAWFGREPTQVATKRNALESLSVDEATEAPLVDVLVRAALGTDAGVRVVSNSSLLLEGAGALLRWR
jgi:peptide subunit release factor 1 (eRF1)